MPPNDEAALPGGPDTLNITAAEDTTVGGEDRVVFTFPKNSREEVRATMTTFHGRRLGDVRVYRADSDDVDHPTKKGIAVRVEDLPKLLEAVRALIAAHNAEPSASAGPEAA